MGELATADPEFNRYDNNQNITIEETDVTIMATSYFMYKIGE